MHEESNPLARVAAARVDFLDHGNPRVAGVSDLVVASWERSRVAGVDVFQPDSVFTENINTDSLLTRCGRPVLEQFAADAGDLPLTIGVIDRKGRVVQRCDSSKAISRLFDRVQYAPGFNFSESTMGTNAAGTVLEAGQAVSVVGPEHFSEKLEIFGATGAPIIDPVTGRIEGALTIALPVESWNPIATTLAKTAAKDIAGNLLRDRSEAQQVLFDAFLRSTARSPRSAVFAFGHTVAITSPAAQQLFEPAEQQLLCEHAVFLLAHKDRIRDTVTLPDRQLVVRIRGGRVFNGSKAVGSLVIADPTMSLPIGPPAGSAGLLLPNRPPGASTLVRAPESSAGGRSPAWLRARSELREALRQLKPTLLVGEAGSGKYTLVTEVFHAVYPGARCVVLDVARPGIESPPPHSPAAPTLHVLRSLDRAGADGVERLRDYLAAVESRDEPGWVVATAERAEPGPDLPFAELLSHFDTAITVPPLRSRTDDLPGVAAAVLRRIAPHRRVLLSPAAQQLISRYSWPRNISELREALEHALRRRPVGEIGEADLPGYCRTAARRSLTVLEGVERDAIVAALHDTNGNRVAAAAQLGMSRSSLYRKLKTYGITT